MKPSITIATSFAGSLVRSAMVSTSWLLFIFPSRAGDRALRLLVDHEVRLGLQAEDLPRRHEPYVARVVELDPVMGTLGSDGQVFVVGDLRPPVPYSIDVEGHRHLRGDVERLAVLDHERRELVEDRKSTRLNSSHVRIS